MDLRHQIGPTLTTASEAKWVVHDLDADAIEGSSVDLLNELRISIPLGSPRVATHVRAPSRGRLDTERDPDRVSSADPLRRASPGEIAHAGDRGVQMALSVLSFRRMFFGVCYCCPSRN